VIVRLLGEADERALSGTKIYWKNHNTAYKSKHSKMPKECVCFKLGDTGESCLVKKKK